MERVALNARSESGLEGKPLHLFCTPILRRSWYQNAPEKALAARGYIST